MVNPLAWRDITKRCLVSFLVVVQFYESEVNNEYVIRGNAAVLKCSIPSFVADFVAVFSWQDDSGTSYTPNDAYGNSNGALATLTKFSVSADQTELGKHLVLT